MPIYEYECKSCEKAFETYLPIMKTESGAKCPKCGSEDVERVFSTFFDRNSTVGFRSPSLSGG